MNKLPKENKIHTLVGTALLQSKDLTEGRDQQVGESLGRVQKLLTTPTKERNQILLILSAAITHMRVVERLVIEGMRLDKWVSLYEEGILVRIRLICAEVIGLLTDATEELKLASVKVRS